MCSLSSWAAASWSIAFQGWPQPRRHRYGPATRTHRSQLRHGDTPNPLRQTQPDRLNEARERGDLRRLPRAAREAEPGGQPRRLRSGELRALSRYSLAHSIGGSERGCRRAGSGCSTSAGAGEAALREELGHGERAYPARVVVLSCPARARSLRSEGQRHGLHQRKVHVLQQRQHGAPQRHDLGRSVGGVRRLRVLPLEHLHEVDPPGPLVGRLPDAFG